MPDSAPKPDSLGQAAAVLLRHRVPADWVDYNGHMRDAYYGLIFSLACDAMMDGPLHLDATQRAVRGLTLYTLEMHMQFLREMKQDAALSVSWRLIAHDHKRLHVAMQLLQESGAAAANGEMLLICVNSKTGRSCAWDADLAEQIACQSLAQQDWPVREFGRGIRLPRPAATDS